jgi:hypothetical protein
MILEPETSGEDVATQSHAAASVVPPKHLFANPPRRRPARLLPAEPGPAAVHGDDPRHWIPPLRTASHVPRRSLDALVSPGTVTINRPLASRARYPNVKQNASAQAPPGDGQPRARAVEGEGRGG